MTKAPRRLTDKNVITTFRLLLAACIKEYGVLGVLTLTQAQLERAGNGTLAVADRPDGSIVLRIKEGRVVLDPMDPDAPPPKSWWCDTDKVEVHDRRCPHCGKLKGDKA